MRLDGRDMHLYRQLSRINLAIVNAEERGQRLKKMLMETENGEPIAETFLLIKETIRTLKRHRQEVLNILNARLPYQDMVYRLYEDDV